MKPADFSDNAPGQLVLVERPRTQDEYDAPEHHKNRPAHIHAFLPNPLPPKIELDSPLATALTSATFALGRLEGRAEVTAALPNPTLLLRPIQRREAIESSRIEGSIADLDDLVVSEAMPASEPRSKDVIGASNYVAALRGGLEQVEERGLTAGLIRELHAHLFDGVSAVFVPGAFRTRPLFIGQRDERAENARFVPAPPGAIQDLIEQLASFATEAVAAPVLIKIALVHYQFEAIHPFPDGNGRVGRMLIPIMLRQEQMLNRAAIDISAYIARNRDRYIDALHNVSTQGAWNTWILFFLEAIEHQAIDARQRFDALLALRERYIRLIAGDLRTPHAAELVDHLIEHATITTTQVAAITGVAFSTAGRYIVSLQKTDIVTPAGDRKRDRVFVAREILAVLDARPGGNEVGNWAKPRG